MASVCFQLALGYATEGERFGSVEQDAGGVGGAKSSEATESMIWNDRENPGLNPAPIY